MSTRPINVLIVNDEEEDVRLIENAFANFSYAVHYYTLNTSYSILGRFYELIKKQQPLPDIIFLDITRNTDKGYDAIKRLRIHLKFRKIPLILLKSEEESENIPDKVTFANGYLTKPLCKDDLDEVVEVIDAYWDAFVDSNISKAA